MNYKLRDKLLNLQSRDYIVDIIKEDIMNNKCPYCLANQDIKESFKNQLNGQLGFFECHHCRFIYLADMLNSKLTYHTIQIQK